MADDDVRLAIKLCELAGLYHPNDWIRVYESHTEYEWALQQLRARLMPWGEDRADFRAAMNTAAAIASQMVEPDTEAIGRTIEALRSYLPEGDGTETDDPATLRQIAEAMRSMQSQG